VIGHNHKDTLGRSPLHLAASGGHEAVIRVLMLEGDFDEDDQDIYGRTSLATAAFGGFVDIAEFLISQVQSVIGVAMKLILSGSFNVIW